MRPDREAVITPLGSGRFMDVEPGVRLECLVGPHVGARDLTTGLVTIAPGGSLSYHTHEFAESITSLEGRALVLVEGREYELEPLDNVVVPRGPAHLIRNLSDQEPLLFHVALASNTPARTMVPDTFDRRAMPADSTGFPGRNGSTASAPPPAPRRARAPRSSTSSTTISCPASR